MGSLVAIVAAAAAAAGGGPAERVEPRQKEPQRKPLIRDGAVAAAREFARGREGTVSFAVVGYGNKVRGYEPTRTYPSASVAKAMLMVAVLNQAADRALTAEEEALLGPMITESKNPPARTLFARVGSAGLNAVAERAGMVNFYSPNSLFESQIAAGDQARFFLKIDELVAKRHRGYARRLLSGIIEPHQWGIPPAAEERSLAWFLKGGWRSDVVHQVALLERRKDRDRRVALAVLSATTNQGYGRATVEGVARRVLARKPGARSSSRRRSR